ncbi:flagellar protein, FliL [Methanobrevibacter sp.]|uniref:flagellar protein, FliL n=1 Tax=Methanobrevibacter sp. TaxID=66852 RepID=UPI0025D90F64|nr:flagellar protein, FliL [Methanobrevibacter sp.]MBR4447398.1 flagellar protein, FliL [Methanobrevibacter sp.]
MKGFILVILAIIAAVLVVGGAVAYEVMNEAGVGIDDADSNIIGKLLDKVRNVESSGSSNSNSNSGGSVVDTVNDIVKEEVKFNAQNGEGYYREVTYKDGGFRQYDTETGELIGSSYDSDQDKLPSLE